MTCLGPEGVVSGEAAGGYRVARRRCWGDSMRSGAIVIVIWLVIGALASYQRGYLGQSDVNCAELGTVLVTILAGPLNYVGINPRIQCEVPQPSS